MSEVTQVCTYLTHDVVTLLPHSKFFEKLLETLILNNVKITSNHLLLFHSFDCDRTCSKYSDVYKYVQCVEYCNIEMEEKVPTYLQLARTRLLHYIHATLRKTYRKHVPKDINIYVDDEDNPMICIVSQTGTIVVWFKVECIHTETKWEIVAIPYVAIVDNIFNCDYVIENIEYICEEHFVPPT